MAIDVMSIWTQCL